jgi:hypothetical protein
VSKEGWLQQGEGQKVGTCYAVMSHKCSMPGSWGSSQLCLCGCAVPAEFVNFLGLSALVFKIRHLTRFRLPKAIL